jgi:hypothetical protein
MAAGGKRVGAGRKKTAEKAAAAAIKVVVDQRIAEIPGVTPLEVLLECMLSAREEGDSKAAASYANMAAPYVHPKLSSITSNNTNNGNLTLVSDFPG